MHDFTRAPALLVLIATIILLAGCQSVQAQNHRQPVVSEINLQDRTLEVWTWRPASEDSRGVILFSHGAASAPWKYEALIAAWADEGYVVHAPLHVDSADHPRTADFPGLASWRARLEDMHALADQRGGGEYIAAGHSYGALVGLTLGGATPARPEGFDRPMSHPGAQVVLAFSPPGQIPGFVSSSDYASLSVPALIQTGTADIPPDKDSYQEHLDAYHAAAAGGARYALILEGVDHYFGGAICRPELDAPRQFRELSIASDIAMLFIRSYTEDDRDAQLALSQHLAAAAGFSLHSK